MGNHISAKLESEANRVTKLLAGKVVGRVLRPSSGEIIIVFDDGSRLFVNSVGDSLELSITQG